MSEFKDDAHCFVCGPLNPNGLHLEFDVTEAEARTRMRFPTIYQGWQDVTHGGLVSTLMDEVMVKAAGGRGIECVTSELKVRFRRPVPTEKDLEVRGWVTDVRRRLVYTEAEVKDASGQVLATATAVLFASAQTKS